MPEALAVALIAAQKELPAVEADKVNPHFGSPFVSLDHLIAKTKPVLTKNGLAIVQMPSETESGKPGLTTILMHESGESVRGTVPLILAKQDMQGLGAALTYARRYGWASALGICDEADDDGNNASQTYSAPPDHRDAPTEPPIASHKAPDKAQGSILAGDVDASAGGGEKYQGKKVRDLTKGQLSWLSGQWAPEGKSPWEPKDVAQRIVRQAVEAFLADPQAVIDDNTPFNDDDIPF